MKKIYILVNLQVEGVHSWSSCDITQVSYLKNIHRHQFYIRVEKSVSHTDRDIEIIKFKREIKQYLINKYWCEKYQACNFGNMSCEDICIDIDKQFKTNLVKVTEDNENGAILK